MGIEAGRSSLLLKAAMFKQLLPPLLYVMSRQGKGLADSFRKRLALDLSCVATVKKINIKGKREDCSPYKYPKSLF